MAPNLCIRNRRLKGRRGNAIVEFAIMSTVLIALCMGTVDFARAFFHVSVITEAAAAGASYGAIRAAYSGRFSEMRNVAIGASSDISYGGNPTATADRYCDCPANPANGPGHANAVNCSTATCPGYGPPRVYVRTRTNKTFQTLGAYPLMPNTLAGALSAYRRVQ